MFNKINMIQNFNIEQKHSYNKIKKHCNNINYLEMVNTSQMLQLKCRIVQGRNVDPKKSRRKENRGPGDNGRHKVGG